MKTKIFTLPTNVLSAGILMFLLTFASFANATITSNGGGNWSDGSTWIGGNVPTASDDVIIAEGDQVNIDITNAAAASILINNGTNNNSHSYIVFSFSTSKLTVSGSVTLGNNFGPPNHFYGVVDMAAAPGGILIAGSLVDGTNNAQSLFFGGTGSVTIKSPSTLPSFYVGGGSSYNNLTIDVTSGTVSMAANTTVTGNLLINSGTLDATTSNRQLTINGNFVANGSFNARGGLVKMTGTTAQVFDGVTAGFTLNSLTVTNTNSVTMNVPVIVNGTLTLGTNVVLSLGDNNLILAASPSGTFGNGSFIQTFGAGALQMPVSTSGTVFPIGYGGYNPITVKAGTTGETFSAKVFAGSVTDKNGNVITSHVANATWTVNIASGTDNSVVVTPQWNLSDEITSFNRAKSYVAVRTSDVGGNPNAVWIETKTPAASSPSTGTGPFTQTSGTISVAAGTNSFLAVGDFVSPLPVTLVSFNALYENNQVDLNWATASEINNHYFNVERSIDGQTWETIGRVEGHGNSLVMQNYSSTDNLAGVIPTGTIYYRLEQFDFNGASNFSMIRSVTINSVPVTVNTYPNPVSNTLNVNWANEDNNNTVLKLVNIAGATIYTENVTGMGMMHKQIDLSTYPTGTYILQIVNDTKAISQTVIKN